MRRKRRRRKRSVHCTGRHKILMFSDIVVEGDDIGIIQEFIEDLYLMDGYRFDIGVYVTITSVNPLRAYIFNDWRLK